MPKKNKDAEDFEKLREMGFELKTPQDEYSYQPDSGSAIGGVRGRQEYGINPVLDAENPRAQRMLGKMQGAVLEADTVPIEEILDEAKPVILDDTALTALVSDRLEKHPKLRGVHIEVLVHNAEVTLRGKVSSDSAKLLAEEVVEAMPGVAEIHNNVQVELGHAGP